jgi:hypothetical protein
VIVVVWKIVVVRDCLAEIMRQGSEHSFIVGTHVACSIDYLQSVNVCVTFWVVFFWLDAILKGIDFRK